MNRLHHLKQTLPINFANNINYKELEFVLLDYNSTDGLESYIRNNFQEHIDSGKLIYYKTTTPQYFMRSHSRNLAFKLSSGNILCNIDADNFTGQDFAQYVNHKFAENDNIFLSTSGIKKLSGKADVLGRICVKKDDFNTVTGFDERMEYYGFEDNDLINRLQLFKLRNIMIEEPSFLNSVKHSKLERIANEYVINNIEVCLIGRVSTAKSELLFFFKNWEFKRGTMINNLAFNSSLGEIIKQPEFEYSISQTSWVEGHWVQRKNGINLIYQGNEVEHLVYDAKCKGLVAEGSSGLICYEEVRGKDFKEEAVSFYSQITNRLVMEANRSERNIFANKSGYGRGTVFKNFDYQKPIFAS